jgi:hypothetical protein
MTLMSSDRPAQRSLNIQQSTLSNLKRSFDTAETRWNDQCMSRVLQSIEKRCIDYPAAQLAHFETLVHEGLLKRVSPDQGRGSRFFVRESVPNNGYGRYQWTYYALLQGSFAIVCGHIRRLTYHEWS